MSLYTNLRCLEKGFISSVTRLVQQHSNDIVFVVSEGNVRPESMQQEESTKALPNEMSVDAQLLPVFPLPKDFHSRPPVFIKAAELPPQRFPSSWSAPAPLDLPHGKPSRTWKQNSSLLLRNDHGKHCRSSNYRFHIKIFPQLRSI